MEESTTRAESHKNILELLQNSWLLCKVWIAPYTTMLLG